MMAMHSAQELVSLVETLISLPSVYQHLREKTTSPDTSLAEVARLVAIDPALSARLLRMVNSVAYGYSGQIDSIDRAVTLLGMQKLHDLVLAMSVSTVFSSIRPQQVSMRLFWHNSVMCGLTAQAIARHCSQPATERMFTLGLLADLGHLVLYQTVPELAEQAWALASDTEMPLYQAEQQMIGCDYAEVGAALMAYWKIPPFFTKVIGAQTQPKLAGEFLAEATILHLAAHIARTDSEEESGKEVIARMMPVVSSTWALLDIAPEDIPEIRADAMLNFSSYIAQFFPHQRI